MKRDKLGRRIGANTWRDHITQCWSAADHAWWCAMENSTSLYDTEVREWKERHPRPMLRDFMLALSESWSRGKIAA